MKEVVFQIDGSSLTTVKKSLGTWETSSSGEGFDRIRERIEGML